MTSYQQPYTSQNIQVKRDGSTLYVYWIGAKGQHYQLYRGKKADPSALTELVEENDTGTFSFQQEVNDLPAYYRMKVDDHFTNVFGERVLPLQHAINYRDMGGYRTSDGRITKWGVLYRSDQLSKLSKEDCELLERYGLKTIVDYRSAHERKLNPNKTIATVQETVWCDPQSSFSEAAANATDLNEENKKLVRQLEEGLVDAKYVNGKGLKVIEDYRHMVTSPNAQEAYERFLSTCSQVQNAPLVHHCRGGKDRTGFGSMLLLLALGVRDEDIIEDYILTGVIRTERNALKYRLYHELTQNQDYLDYLMSMIETRSAYIEASLDEIRKNYPSTDHYLMEHFHLSPENLSLMRETYLEKDCEANL